MDSNKMQYIFAIQYLKIKTTFMQEQQHGGNYPAKRPNLQVTREMLNSVKQSTDVLDLPAVRDNWLRTYKNTTGKTDGELRFEAEKVMFIQTIKSSAALMRATNDSLYIAWIELSLSGVSLRDGQSYIIPSKDKAELRIGWKGRLEQIKAMPAVIDVQEPQIVYSCDKFRYERGMQVKIHEHIPMYPRPDGSVMHFVYLVITFTYGTKCYIMDRDEVLEIRNNRSDSYKQYLKDAAIAVNGKITKNGPNGQYQADLQIPAWVSSEAQMWRKTIVRRVYNNMDKLPNQKFLDQKHEATAHGQDTDPEEMNGQFNYEGAFNVSDPGHESTPYAEVISGPDETVQPKESNPQQPGTEQSFTHPFDPNPIPGSNQQQPDMFNTPGNLPGSGPDPFTNKIAGVNTNESF